MVDVPAFGLHGPSILETKADVPPRTHKGSLSKAEECVRSCSFPFPSRKRQAKDGTLRTRGTHLLPTTAPARSVPAVRNFKLRS